MAYQRNQISDRHRRLAYYYFEANFNKDEAARRAGYQNVNKYSNRLFAREDVKQEIEKIRRKMMEKMELTNDWIIQRLMLLANSNVVLAKFRKVQEDGSLAWDFTGATEEELALIHNISTDTYVEGRGEGAKKVKKFKVEIIDPKNALDTLARIQGLFQEKQEVSVEVNLVDALQKGRERARVKNEGEQTDDGDSSGHSASTGAE